MRDSMRNGFEKPCQKCSEMDGKCMIERAENCLKESCEGNINAWLSLEAEAKASDFYFLINHWTSFVACMGSVLAVIISIIALENVDGELEASLVFIISVLALGVMFLMVVMFAVIYWKGNNVRVWGKYLRVLLEDKEVKKRLLKVE